MSSSGAQGAVAGTGLPASAVAVGARNPYDALRTLYNAKAARLARFRGALANAQAGLGFVDIGIVADSLALFNGAVFTQAWPAFMRAQLAAMYGLVQRPGLIPGVGMNDLSVLAGGMGTAGGVTYPTAAAAGATWTCNLPVPCTSIFLIGPKTNAAAATTTIDAVAANPFPIPGGAGYQSVNLAAGLADAVHTVVVTTGSAGAASFHSLLGTGGAAGIRIHNLGVNGTYAGAGNVNQNWSNFGATSIVTLRLAALAAAGIVPHLWIYCLATNDEILGQSAAQVVAGALATIAALPGAPGTPGQTSDLLLMAPWGSSAVALATQQAVQGQYYAMADSLDVPMFDWYEQVQGQAGGVANGMISGDNLHTSTQGNKITGIRLAQSLAA